MAVLKRAAGMPFGLLACFFGRRTRAGRERAKAARSRTWHDLAARDPDFLAETADVDRAFDAAGADGLTTEAEVR